ncbi:hypothetical protein T439DRAFT_351794 [Meredithblackwellia eburnea MCA 4105]
MSSWTAINKPKNIEEDDPDVDHDNHPAPPPNSSWTPINNTDDHRRRAQRPGPYQRKSHHRSKQHPHPAEGGGESSSSAVLRRPAVDEDVGEELHAGLGEGYDVEKVENLFEKLKAKCRQEKKEYNFKPTRAYHARADELYKVLVVIAKQWYGLNSEEVNAQSLRSWVFRWENSNQAGQLEENPPGKSF